MRKILAMLLTLALVLSLAAPVFATDAKSDDIVILYTNDVHTYIDNDLSYDVLAAIKAEYQTQYNNVLLVDAGDHIQGTAYGSMDKGATIIELMNAAGYDLATLGNHEFDYGMDGCINVRSWANFPYVSCNFYNESAGVRGTNVLDSYKLFTFGGETIAFIGMTTPESFTKSTPAYFQDAEGNYIYGIAGGEDGSALYADVQKAIDEAKAEGATIIIGLGHLGDDPASQPWTSLETIANVSGLDAFIDGHSHSTVKGQTVSDKDGNNVLLTQTGEYFNRIGIMIIDAETGEITTDFIEATDVTPDETVKAIKDAWIAEIDTQLGQVIGSTELVLDNYDENGKRIVRKQETNTGDFAADALYYLFDNMDMDVDVAIMNGGGVRNKAITGDISYKTCKNIHTFGNVACLQTITGQQLLDALEWGARGTPNEEIGGFLHVSGITYKIDTTIESTVQIDNKGVWCGAPTGEYRVHSVMIYNKETNTYEPLDLDATYNLAGYNYTLRDLGDGFAMFDGAVNVLDYVMEDYMVLANYVKGYENGVVGADNSPLLAKYENLVLDYSTVNGSGRIVQAPKSDDIVIDYYLVGFINGADYGCEGDYQNLGEYKFVDGQLVATFTKTSYVFVKTGDNANWYMTNGWLGEVTSATLYNTAITGENSNKLYVPGNVEVTFTLVENADGSLTLSYTTSAAEPVAGPTLTGSDFSLSFEDEILVNFYYTVSDMTNVVEQGMLVFYTDPTNADIAKADDVCTGFTSDGSVYLSTTSGIAAKEMGDNRYYCAYAKLSDGTYAYSPLYQYSPRTYATNMLAKSSTSAGQKALCVAMLNYGAAAQVYFNYKTDDLMNADLTADQQALVVAYDASLFTGAVAADASKTGNFTKTDTGFSSRSASVSFEGAFAINYYFAPSATMAGNMTLYYWTPSDYAAASELTADNASGSMAMVAAGDGSYWGQVRGIAARDLDETYYVAAFYTDADGNTYCTGVIAYSLSRYCMNNVKDGNAMQELAAATAMYGYYAKEYFANR